MNGDRTITIRRADASDLDILVALNRHVQALHAALYPADFKAQVDDGALRPFLRSIIERDGNQIMLAECAGTALGYVWIERQIRVETPLKFAPTRIFLHHICVDPQHRRAGIGSALMGYIEQIAARTGAEEIALDTWSANHVAQDFFRRHGFDPFRVFMRKTGRSGTSL